MKIGIVIATRDPFLLDLTLRSHLRFTPADAPVGFYIVDTVGAGAAIRPATYSGWNHHAAEAAMEDGCDLLLFSNDDIVVTPGWLGLMLQDLATLRRAGRRPGLLGACSNCISGAQACIGSGGTRGNGTVPDRDENGNLQLRPFSGPLLAPCVYTNFALLPAQAYRDSGGFDLELPAHYGADDILSYRLLRAGYENAISRAFVCHFGSETFRAHGVDPMTDSGLARAYIAERYPEMGTTLRGGAQA